MCQRNSAVRGKVGRIAPISDIPGEGGILEVVSYVHKIEEIGKVCFSAATAKIDGISRTLSIIWIKPSFPTISCSDQCQRLFSIQMRGIVRL